jgi:hypothetical protein
MTTTLDPAHQAKSVTPSLTVTDLLESISSLEGLGFAISSQS